MTREDHLKFCKVCTNRKLNPKIGLVCSLTDSIADFHTSCPNFNVDKTEELKYFLQEVQNAGDLGDKEFPIFAQGSNYKWNISIGLVLFIIGLLGLRFRMEHELIVMFRIYLKILSTLIMGYGIAIAKRGFAQRKLIKAHNEPLK